MTLSTGSTPTTPTSASPDSPFEIEFVSFTPRLKFSKELDFHLLKQVQAGGAQVTERAVTLLRFSEVSGNLNRTSLLPWKTDGNHYQDRFKIIVAQWRANE